MEVPPIAKTADADATIPAWEGRSVDQVLRGGRDRLLARSRRIVVAGQELISKHGLEALTLRAVLKRTGLSRRAFYERFGSKDDLLLAIFEDTILTSAQRFTEEIAELDDPMERLRSIIVSMITESHSRELRRRSVALSREELRLTESHPEELDRALQPMINLIAEQLANGVDAGVMRDEGQLETAVMIYRLVASTVHSALLGSPLSEEYSAQTEAQARELAETVWGFCKRAISK